MTEVNSGQSGRSIGLFGGSFDPPHSGHVALVLAGLGAGLDEIRVIPALPVHRQLSGLADGPTRFDWLSKIFADQPRVQVVDWEIRRQRPTPAIDTLRQFRHMHPDTTPWLMLGADAWAGLPSWRDYPAHRALCNVAVFARRGAESETGHGSGFETVCGHDGWKQIDLKDCPDCRESGHWAYIQADLPDISATGLREDTRCGKTLAGKVPEIVRRNIEQIYGNSMENM